MKYLGPAIVVLFIFNFWEVQKPIILMWNKSIIPI